MCVCVCVCVCVCDGKKRRCTSSLLHTLYTDLCGELSQPCGYRQTLLEQQAVEGIAAECLQIHLVFIIPELLQGVCTDHYQETSETQRQTGRERDCRIFFKKNKKNTHIKNLLPVSQRELLFAHNVLPEENQWDWNASPACLHVLVCPL